MAYEVNKSFTDHQMVNMGQNHWQQAIANMREEIIAQIEADGESQKEYIFVMHEDKENNSVTLKAKHRRELVR